MFAGFDPHNRFRQDDTAMALVLLRLLEEQMGTALELVDRLKSRFGARLSFEAGEIYPLLQYLEDRGFVTQEPIGDRKVYAVTEAGFAFLAEQSRAEQEAAQTPPRDEEAFCGWGPHQGPWGRGPWGHAPWARGHHHRGPWGHGHRPHPPMHELRELIHEFKHLARQFKHSLRHSQLSPQQLERLRAILHQTRQDVAEVLTDRPHQGLG